MAVDSIQVLAGAVTGILVGLTGVGGGALMTPLLLLFFGVAPLAAVGTDLWFAAITKLVGSGVHHSRGLVDWQVVRRLWSGSLSATAATLLWMRWKPVDRSSVDLLVTLIALALLCTALGIVFQKSLHRIGTRWRTTRRDSFKAMQGPLTVAAGVLLGFLVTLTSVGAGALGTVLLTYLYPLRLTPQRLIATDIVHAIPLAVLAGIGHLFIGDVRFDLLGNLLLGSIPGVVVGASFSARLPGAWLRLFLAAALIGVGVKLLWH